MVSLAVDRIRDTSDTMVSPERGIDRSHESEPELPPVVTRQQAISATLFVPLIKELRRVRSALVEKDEQIQTRDIEIDALHGRLERIHASEFPLNTRLTANVEQAKALYCATMGKTRL
ncbi:MAG: hypothetical protein NVS2B16_20030 [Chloroflexota bacterium]